MTASAKPQKQRMALTKRADTAFSKAVRARGMCELAPMRPDLECAGALQCCHVLSRSYRAVRWMPQNALAGCAAHHVYFTHRPLEWEDACRAAGVEWDYLRWAALNTPPMDPGDLLRRSEAP